EDNLAVPHNAYGRQGLHDLAALADTKSASWGGGRLRLSAGPPRQFNDIDDWDRDLNKIQERTILLVFAAHGAGGAKGAYLLPQRSLLPGAADPQEPDNRRLYLTKILERLKKLPRQRNLVLVLDATQMTAQWPLGMLHNDFARALEKLN